MEAIIMEDESFPTVEEIIPHNPGPRSHFFKEHTHDPEPVKFEMEAKHIAALKAK